jgi:site-specific DNA-methyltransferase (adenine-specific)
LIGTLAANVEKWGTGAINIDDCRVGVRERPKVTDPKHGGHTHNCYGAPSGGGKLLPDGRFPANVIHDGSEEVLAEFPAKAGGGDKRGECSGRRPSGFGDVGADKGDGAPNARVYADSGSAARFFYCAKATKAERAGSKHPTVKPIALMRWLCRLVTPPSGTILDPFAGTGTTGAAALAEGFNCVLIEREEQYLTDIARRFENGAV